jgi:hypothetical protein
MLDAVLEEVTRCELATAIGRQCAKFSLRLGLGSCLEHLEHHHGFILGTQQHEPHVAANNVDEKEEVSLDGWCRRRDQPHKSPRTSSSLFVARYMASSERTNVVVCR